MYNVKIINNSIHTLYMRYTTEEPYPKCDPEHTTLYVRDRSCSGIFRDIRELNPG